MGVRLLEKDTLAADAEHKFVVSMRLDLTQMLDQFDGLAPTQVMRQLAVEKILIQRFQVLAHLRSIVLSRYKAEYSRSFSLASYECRLGSVRRFQPSAGSASYKVLRRPPARRYNR